MADHRMKQIFFCFSGVFWILKGAATTELGTTQFLELDGIGFPIKVSSKKKKKKRQKQSMLPNNNTAG